MSARWKGRNDALVSESDNGSLIIHDSRPAAVAGRTVLKGIEADVYEYCDSRRTLEHIRAWLAEGGRNVGTKRIDGCSTGFSRSG